MPSQHTDDKKLLCSRAEKHDIELRNQAATFRFITEFFLDDPGRSPYTISVILELHRLTIKDIYPCSGNFRTALNLVEIRGASIAPVHPSQVVNEMNDLLEMARVHSETEHSFTEEMDFAAKSFHRFLAVHPFSGGNGRVARCFLILMLYEKKVLSPPSHLFDYIEKRRSAYLPALQEADKGYMHPLSSYLSRGALQSDYEKLLVHMERLNMKEYVLKRLPRDQRRLCHPHHHASLTDDQFIRESIRFGRSMRKIIAKMPRASD